MEFIWSGSVWQEFGSTGSLGTLAFKNNASTNFTPHGSVTGTAVTLNTTTVEGMDGVGTLPELTMTVSNENLTIGFSQGTLPTKATAQTVATGVASITQPSFTGTEETITVS